MNSSVQESLHYACKHYCDTPANFVVISPTTLSQDHDISPRLYQKVALQVKAANGEWDNIDRLLLTKVHTFGFTCCLIGCSYSYTYVLI